MEFNAVYHQASDNYCYPLNEDELIINIKTGYDVKSVSIILGDPFAAGILGGGEHWAGRVWRRAGRCSRPVRSPGSGSPRRRR